jgi:hypothetical protein
MKVIFIAGLGHSGSTLLELVLSANEGCVGIGEVFQLVDPNNKLIYNLEGYECSCSKEILNCNFWKTVIQELSKNTDLCLTKKYEVVLQKCKEAFGENAIVIDSSKSQRALSALKDIPDIDLKVLHLIRDVRPWSMSIKKANIRNKVRTLRENIKKFGVKGVIKYLRRNRYYVFYNWWRTNNRITKIITDNKLESLVTSYERFCFNSNETLEEIYNFLGTDFDANSIDMLTTNNHNIFGNRMRFDKEKRKQIRYDMDWIYKNEWVLPYFVMTPVRNYNQKTLRELK